MTAIATQPITADSLYLYGASGQLYDYIRDEEVLLEGRAGTGKSIGAALKLIWACRQYPGSRHLLCRQTRASMTDTTLVTFESVLGESSPEVTRISKEQRHSYRIHGSEVVCAGLDEPAKAFGSAWGIIVVEEAIETTLDAWELFGRSARDPKLRRKGDVDNFPYHQRIAITNPGPRNHWLNTRATPCSDDLRRIDTYDDLADLHAYNREPQAGKMRRLVSVHQDNPAFFDADKWAWTEAGKRYIASLSTMSSHRRARMLDGRWATAEGGVFPEFNDDPKVKPCNVGEPFPAGWPRDWPVYVGYDPGYAHPCAVVFWGVAPNEQPFIIDEIHGSGWDIDRLGPAIKEKARKYRIVRWLDDPRGANQRREIANGKTIRDYMREKFGLPFQPWQAAEGSGKQSQVEAVRLLLIDKARPLVVWNTCPGVIGEFQSWAYAKNADGTLKKGDDAYEDRNNDAMDAIMGIVADSPRFQSGTVEVFSGHDE